MGPAFARDPAEGSGAERENKSDSGAATELKKRGPGRNRVQKEIPTMAVQDRSIYRMNQVGATDHVRLPVKAWRR